MWPQWAHSDIIHGADGFAYACKKLEASVTSVATHEEAKLARIVLARASQFQSTAVVSSVCRVALAWKDLPLWFEAVKVCDAERSLETLEEGNIYRALETFGTEKILPWYVESRLLVTRNTRRVVDSAYDRFVPGT